MKRFIIIGCVGAVVASCLAIALKGAQRPAAPAVSPRVPVAAPRPMGKLVVHEWGTFTGFAGSDGVHLPFNTVVGSDLPSFVMNRLKHAERLNPKSAALAGMVFVKGGGAAALQRLETPVMYFYADAPGNVDVRVDFTGGLLTEFYPPVRSMGPRYGAAPGEIDIPGPDAPAHKVPATLPSLGPFAESFLDWGRVRIVPHPTGDEGKLVPAATGANHYQFARDTDAALVRFADSGGKVHEEKFLFYRGLGNFKLPVALSARGGDRFEFRNAGASPVGWAFLIQVDADRHAPPRFARFEDLAGMRELKLPPTGAPSGNLAEAITKSLVSSGLYEKEARAMVQTWKASWLDEPGTRVLYVVPRAVTDGLLPLRVEPAPDETVRVLVGRIDVLTPEQESRLRAMLLSAGPTGTLPEPDVRLLSGLGRFLAPALERAGKQCGAGAAGRLERLQDAFSRSLAGGK